MRFEFKWRCFDFPCDRCILFGVLNITPDSFSDGGRFTTTEAAVEQAHRLQQNGADVIDVGGESTRPGATPVSMQEEMDRVLPVIRSLKKHLRIPISIDTTKASVAEAALFEGAEIVNDISGLSADPRMAGVIASSRAGLILMHSRGTPATMQTLCNYQNVVEDVLCELHQRLQVALDAGILPDRIAIDPGIGFAKTADQNLALLRNLKTLVSAFDHPMMIGISRKSFLGGEVATRGPATLAAEIRAAQQGVHMIRTHDVTSLRQALATQMVGLGKRSSDQTTEISSRDFS